MHVNYAHCIYEGNKVTVVVHNNDGTAQVELHRCKPWTHRKCAEKALEELGMQPALDFHYGWEIRD